MKKKEKPMPFVVEVLQETNKKLDLIMTLLALSVYRDRSITQKIRILHTANLSIKQIADIMDMPQKSIKKLL